MQYIINCPPLKAGFNFLSSCCDMCHLHMTHALQQIPLKTILYSRALLCVWFNTDVLDVHYVFDICPYLPSIDIQHTLPSSYLTELWYWASQTPLLSSSAALEREIPWHTHILFCTAFGCKMLHVWYSISHVCLIANISCITHHFDFEENAFEDESLKSWPRFNHKRKGEHMFACIYNGSVWLSVNTQVNHQQVWESCCCMSGVFGWW